MADGIIHIAPRQTQLPRAGAEHRALVRHMRCVECEVAADLAAIDAMERLAILLDYAPLSDAARSLARDWIYQAREALILRVWPLGPAQ